MGLAKGKRRSEERGEARWRGDGWAVERRRQVGVPMANVAWNGDSFWAAGKRWVGAAAKAAGRRQLGGRWLGTVKGRAMWVVVSAVA